MTKKTIIISIIAVIVIAGAVTGGLVLYKTLFAPVKVTVVTPTTTESTEPVVTPDTSVSYGACDLLTTADIASALGRSTQGPDDMGLVHSQPGDQSQVCVYGFVAGGTIENSFHRDNGFSVEVHEFSTDAAKANFTARIESDGAVMINGVGTSAAFVDSSNIETGVNKYTVYVITATKGYSYEISQPAADDAITSDAAKTSLDTLARSVSY